MMIEDDKILWSLLVDHQLFAVTKLDINVSFQTRVGEVASSKSHQPLNKILNLSAKFCTENLCHAICPQNLMQSCMRLLCKWVSYSLRLTECFL